MKILIEESVLRQALDAIGAALSDDKPYLNECRSSYAAIESALDAAEKVEPVTITDAMAYAFHNALTDGALGAGEVDEIKKGLRAAFADAIHPAPAVPEGCQKCGDADNWCDCEPTPPTNTGTAPDGKMGIRDICAIQLANGRITREQFEQLFPENAHDSELREAAFKVPLYERNPPIIFDESPEVVLNRAEYNELREAARAVVNFWPEMITFGVIERLRKAL